MKKEITKEQYLDKIKNSKPSLNCPIRKTLELIGGKWRTHIIYELCKKNTCRFGELKKALPHITSAMLSNTLKDLENFKIVRREQFNEIPPHVEYSLTEKGKAMLPIFYELAKWSENYLDEDLS